MKISTNELTNQREWRSATGLTENQYQHLLENFKKTFYDTYQCSYAERLQATGVEYCIKDENDLLLFTLFSLKNSLTYDILGLTVGMKGSNAKRQQEHGVEILNKTLQSLQLSPISKLETEQEVGEFFLQFETILIDATEQRIQRPKDKDEQRPYYSGKKKRIH